VNTIGLLLALALVMFLVEIFAPGGILGFIGCILIFSASVVAYRDHGFLWGAGVLFGGLGLAGAFFYFEMRVLLKSGIGQRLFSSQGIQHARVGYAEDELAGLVGQSGIAATRMTPTGKVRVGDRLWSAVSLDGFVAKGTEVVVREASPSSIKVSLLSSSR